MDYFHGAPWSFHRPSKKPDHSKNLARMFKGVFEALEYLHVEKDLVHSDVKSGNLMLSGASCAKGNANFMEACDLKLGDLGLTCKVGSSRCQNVGGSPLYMAPEMARMAVDLVVPNWCAREPAHDRQSLTELRGSPYRVLQSQNLETVLLPATAWPVSQVCNFV